MIAEPDEELELEPDWEHAVLAAIAATQAFRATCGPVMTPQQLAHYEQLQLEELLAAGAEAEA